MGSEEIHFEGIGAAISRFIGRIRSRTVVKHNDGPLMLARQCSLLGSYSVIGSMLSRDGHVTRDKVDKSKSDVALKPTQITLQNLYREAWTATVTWPTVLARRGDTILGTNNILGTLTMWLKVGITRGLSRTRS